MTDPLSPSTPIANISYILSKKYEKEHPAYPKKPWGRFSGLGTAMKLAIDLYWNPKKTKEILDKIPIRDFQEAMSWFSTRKISQLTKERLKEPDFEEAAYFATTVDSTIAVVHAYLLQKKDPVPAVMNSLKTLVEEIENHPANTARILLQDMNHLTRQINKLSIADKTALFQDVAFIAWRDKFTSLVEREVLERRFIFQVPVTLYSKPRKELPEIPAEVPPQYRDIFLRWNDAFLDPRNDVFLDPKAVHDTFGRADISINEKPVYFEKELHFLEHDPFYTELKAALMANRLFDTIQQMCPQLTDEQAKLATIQLMALGTLEVNPVNLLSDLSACTASLYNGNPPHIFQPSSRNNEEANFDFSIAEQELTLTTRWHYKQTDLQTFQYKELTSESTLSSPPEELSWSATLSISPSQPK